jgi:hypothetical protein
LSRNPISRIPAFCEANISPAKPPTSPINTITGPRTGLGKKEKKKKEGEKTIWEAYFPIIYPTGTMAPPIACQKQHQSTRCTFKTKKKPKNKKKQKKKISETDSPPLSANPTFVHVSVWSTDPAWRESQDR